MALNKDNTLVNAMGMLQHDANVTSSPVAGAPAGDNKGEQKSAQDARDLSEAIYTFDPHQKDLFPKHQASRSQSSPSDGTWTAPFRATSVRHIPAEAREGW